MPEAWTAKDERQYERILESCSRQGRMKQECKRMAAATVNKTRRRQGRTLGGAEKIKDLKKIKKLAESQGWTVEHTRSGHTRWVPPDPDKEIIITGKSPSDWRALKNIESRLKRSGLKLDGRRRLRGLGRGTPFEGQTCKRFGPMTAAKRDKLPAKAFGLPGERKYPMPDPSHARNAKARAKQELNRKRLTRREYEQVVRKADRVIAACAGRRG